MEPLPQSSEPEEILVEEPKLKALTDDSLPAAEVIAEQAREMDDHLAPRFIP